jgi:flagellar protein FlbD
MIKLTRMDGSELYINPELIETIEESPDTHITLSNGNHYLVLESAGTIIEKIVHFKATILRRSTTQTGKKYLVRKRTHNYRPVCKLSKN